MQALHCCLRRHEECCAVARRRKGDRTTEGFQRPVVPTIVSGPVRAVARTHCPNSLPKNTPRNLAPHLAVSFETSNIYEMFPVTFSRCGNHTARFHERHRAKSCGKRAKPGDYAHAADRGVS